MVAHKKIALVFSCIAIVLGVIFYLDIQFPRTPEGYFNSEFYNQFGGLAICVELFIAGIHLFKRHIKANFTLALFGFTVALDVVFNLLGIFSSTMPIYARILLLCCAIVSLWLAFTDSFRLGRISFVGAVLSFILGNLVELFFNYW